MRGGDLQAALARTLGDPELVVAYWLPEYEAYADAAGQPVALPRRAATGRSRPSTATASVSPR